MVLHNGPLTLLQEWWVAVLNAGPGAVLCARTALEADGLTGWSWPAVEVLVIRGTQVSRAPQVKVHESRRFVPLEDIHPTRTPPRTTPARSADRCCWIFAT